MLATTSSVTARKLAMFAVAGSRCRTALIVASVVVGNVMKIAPETPAILPIHVDESDRVMP